ncbi:MAG: aldo/keto reductase [Oscillochloridaceae bacterium umkhey_bin13]
MLAATPLPTRPLGAAGPQVTTMGLGLAALGRPGYINLGHVTDLERNYDPIRMQAQAHAVCAAAWQAGVRYFDAARSYGRGEEFLGNWLRASGLAPQAVVVGSKWGYTYTANWRIEAEVHEVKEHTLAVLDRQWHESQANLGNYLQLYQIHSATLESGVLDRPEVLARLADLRATGILIGLSVSGPRQAEVIQRAISLELENRPLFRVVQATWNLLEPSAGPALAEAAAAGCGVIIKEGVANGRLTERNQEPGFAPQRAILQAEATRLGCTLDALALAAALAQPWVSTVLSGAATMAHLQANLMALDVRWDAQAATTLASLAEPPVAYWGTRAAMPWN